MLSFNLRSAALAVALAAGIAAAPAIAEPAAVTAKGVTVGQAWTRATPGGAKVGAAFLTITAAKGAGDKLLSASSPAAARVELHTHTMDDGIMRMRRVESIAVPDGGTVLLQPGGFHIMLIDLAAPLKQGEAIKLGLKFEKAGEVSLDVPIEAIAAKGPHGLTFQPGIDGKPVPGAMPAGDHMHHH